MRYITTKDFLSPYKEFISINTWTKKKRKAYERMCESLRSYKSVEITRKAGVYSLNCLYEFTIMRVAAKKTGYLMPYRNKLVLVMATSRSTYSFTITVYPLKEKTISTRQLQDLNRLKQFVPPATPSDVLN